MFALLFLILEVESVIVYVNETILYPLPDFFGYLENPTYEILDAQNPYLAIIPQYNLHSDTKTHNQSIIILALDADVIISAKAQTYQGYWTNHFLFLELNKGIYNLHYSEKQMCYYSSPQEENVATPKFNEHLMVTNSASDVCFDAEQYDDSHYIIDCAVKTDGQPLQNKFLVISKEQVIKTHTVSNPQQYQSIQKRKISLFYVEDQLYLTQGSIQSGVESIIQIYLINSTDISFIEQEHEISTSILKIILGLDNSYKFYLLDYKVVYNQVYVLDKTFICALSFDKNGDMFLNYYKQLTGNVIAFDYTYYLDDNGVKNSILVILKDKTFDLYYNGQDVVNYQLSSTVSANAKIKVSHQFILIEDENTLYQYRIDNKVLINKKTLSQVNQYLINPIYPDLISISYNLSRRYQISEGYLQLQSLTQSTDLNKITIRATSKSQSTDYSFPLQILKQDDGLLYENGRSKQIITDVIYKAGQTQTIVPFVSGPDIDIGADPMDNPLNLEFEIKQEMHIKEWPNPTTIHFQDMLEFSSQLVYVLFQLKTKEVQIWECIQTFQGLTESCKLDLTTTFPILTNQMHFQWWIADQQAFLIFCDSDYSAELWKLDQNNTMTMVNRIISLAPITQILELHRTLYILTAEDKKIRVYNSNDATIIDSINEKTVKSLGMIKSWSPKKLFGNQKYSSHLLFIQNNDNLMVTIYNNQINLVENVAITDDIEITLFKNTFFMTRINSGKSILEEYSIRDLNNIYLMRQIQLFGYQFYTPLTVAQSEDNGFLFILTTDKKVVLFRPNEENSNDAIFRVLDVQFQDFVTMSACGSKKTHFYFSNGTDSSYFAVLMQPTLYIKSLVSVPVEDFFTSITQTLYFRNFRFSSTFLETIQILNRNQSFTLQAQNISVLEGKSQHMEPINDLYIGQVISIACDNCDSSIQLISPIQVIQIKFVENIKDIEYYSMNYNAAISKDKLYLIDHQENVQDVFTFGSPNSCEYLQVQQNFTYVTVLCNYNSIYHMYLIICDFNFKCKSQDTPKDLTTLQGVSKMILLPDNLVLIQDMGKIQVFSIQIEETTWSLTQTQTIETGKGLTDFIVSEVSNHYYIISIIDQADNLNILYTQFQGNKLNVIQQSSILIYQVILDSKQFALQTTDYIQLFSVSQFQESELDFLIIANDVASVRIKILLNETNQIKSAEVTQVFNPYLDWIALSKAVYFENSLLIPYTNKVDTLLAYYDLNNTHPNFIYGLKDTTFQVTDGLFINYFFKENQVTRLYSNLVNKVMTSYEVRSYPSLKFANTNNLQTTQNITLNADNIQNSQSINVTINKQIVPPPPPPTPDDDNSSGSNWWWITLIVLGSVAILGVGVFFYMKHKQVGLFKVDNGYSLHGVP